jgi:hypothetical protein
VKEWWKTFFDQDYLRIAAQMFSPEDNIKQAADLSIGHSTRGRLTQSSLPSVMIPDPRWDRTMALT